MYYNVLYLFEFVSVLQVTNLLDGFHEIFGDSYKNIVSNQHPELEILYQTIIKRKRIELFLKQQNTQGIVWAHSGYQQLKDNVKKIEPLSH